MEIYVIYGLVGNNPVIFKVTTSKIEADAIVKTHPKHKLRYYMTRIDNAEARVA